MSWTDERVEVLKKLWAEGHSASQIAKQLGGVTRNAVIGKVHRLGLSGRATPSRPVKRPPRLARPKPRVMPDGSVTMPTPAVTTPIEQARPVERTAMIAPLPPLKLADGGAATILTLRDSMCKWPIGDPADPKFAASRTAVPIAASMRKWRSSPPASATRRRTSTIMCVASLADTSR